MSITFEHTLNGVGKTYTFSIGGAGCAKRITRLPHIINKDSINIYGFGQDSLGIFKTDTQLLLSLADGHGPQEAGKTISYKIHEYMLTYISDIQEYILSSIKENNIEIVKEIVTKMFDHVNNLIIREDDVTSKFNKGGTTFTLIHKFIDIENGDLYSLSYNVGDSPYFKISMDGELEELSEEQNCDNIKSVEAYYNHCLDKGVEPSPIILGRFNHTNNYKLPWMGDSPINPYNVEIVDGKYKLSQNTEIMRKVYEEAPYELKENVFNNGGPQSIRGRKANIQALAEGKYPMENFGSTINGNLQTTHSMADKQSIIEQNIACTPHISINKITDPHYDFVGSDGPIDCLTNTDIVEMFKEKPLMDIEEFIKFVTSTVDTKAVEGGFNLSILTGVPTWDDNSFWVVETKIETDSNAELEAKIIELEKQNAELYELAKSIQPEIKIVYEALDKLV